MDKLNDLRKVANINNLNWELLDQPGLPDENVWWFNLSYDHSSGEGSYLYRMDPNTKSKAHQHTGPEEFFILEGDLTDSDGYVYKKGDFVQLSSGSSHYSKTKNGCTSVVTHRGKYIYSKE